LDSTTEVKLSGMDSRGRYDRHFCYFDCLGEVDDMMRELHQNEPLYIGMCLPSRISSQGQNGTEGTGRLIG
jgi:hypothetical protein